MPNRPHACGDEPAIKRVYRSAVIIDPTHVGMNRNLIKGIRSQVGSTPRMWG